jgi:YD repeat-containing protein
MRIMFATAILVTLTAASRPAAAVETEAREFAIEVDGKVAGQYLMTITRQDDGVLSMHSQANLRVKINWFYTYEYTLQGTEHWKNSRLLQLSAKCNDDGTRYDVFAQADARALRVRVNGMERSANPEAWTTSYWMLADKRFHNQKVPLLDADSGKEFTGQLQFIGLQEMNIAGQMHMCQHFRVTGGPTTPVELYYDQQSRLVRQEFTEQGKRVVFILRAIKR